MEYRLSPKQVQGIYTAGRILERATHLEKSISGSGEKLRKEMAISFLEKLPNPAAIERYVVNLENCGLGGEARKLRERYRHIQRFSQDRTDEEG